MARVFFKMGYLLFAAQVSAEPLQLVTDLENLKITKSTQIINLTLKKPVSFKSNCIEIRNGQVVKSYTFNSKISPTQRFWHYGKARLTGGVLRKDGVDYPLVMGEFITKESQQWVKYFKPSWQIPLEISNEAERSDTSFIRDVVKNMSFVPEDGKFPLGKSIQIKYHRSNSLFPKRDADYDAEIEWVGSAQWSFRAEDSKKEKVYVVEEKYDGGPDSLELNRTLYSEALGIAVAQLKKYQNFKVACFNTLP